MTQLASREHNSFLVNVYDSDRIIVSDFNGINIMAVRIFNDEGELVFVPEQSRKLSNWSIDGYLAYCGNGLAVWDGEESVNLDSMRSAFWLFGDNYHVDCRVG